LLDSVLSSVLNRRQYSGILTYFHPQVEKVGRHLRSWARQKEIFLNTDNTDLVNLKYSASRTALFCIVLYSTVADLLDGVTGEPKYIAAALQVVNCVIQTQLFLIS
jgi:hypothetical protein